MDPLAVIEAENAAYLGADEAQEQYGRVSAEEAAAAAAGQQAGI